MATAACVQCGSAVAGSARGRTRIYCSRACRSRAYRERVSGRGPARPPASDPATPVREPGPIGLRTITAAAIDLADREGLTAVSMRRVASTLGSGTMSLYRYVPSREALLDAMIDSVFAAHPLPGDAPEGWRPALERSAELEWQLYQRHPWAAQVLAAAARPPIARGLMAYTDWRLRALEPTGIDLDAAVGVTIALSTVVQAAGVATAHEREHEQAGGTDRRNWFESRRGDIERILEGGGLPMVSRFGATTYAASAPDSVFRFSLDLLLDGAAALIARNQRGSGR